LTPLHRSQHASHPGSIWAKLNGFIYPEPYPDSNDGSVRDRGGTKAPDTSFSGWYTRKKHRAMAKLELSDAFDMRGRVMIALLGWLVFGMSLGVYAVRQVYLWVFT
jgi:hypothetical protein